MAQTSQVSFRIDDEVKRSAESVLNDLGLSMSAAITVFLKKVGREHRIPFELTADPFYSESNIKHLQQSIHQVKNGQVIVKTMEDLEALTDE